MLGVGHLAPGGVWEGNLYLRGGGDPTFGSSRVHPRPLRRRRRERLARSSPSSCAARHPPRHRLRSRATSPTFDSLRGEPSSGYAPDPFLEGTLSALAFNRGESGRERGPHAPAAYAARQLRAALRAADGVEHPAAHAEAERPPPAGARSARGRALADGRPAARPDAAAVGQLLRRDARQGPRRALRRRRHHRRAGRARGARRRSPRCSACTRRSSTARGSPGRPDLALAGRRRCSIELAAHARWARSCATTWRSPGAPARSRSACATPAPQGAARARRARSRASRTSPATARPPTAHSSRSRSSPTASPSKRRTRFQDHMAITLADY